MSEDAELRARIAALSGQINKHRHPDSPLSHPRIHQRWSPYGRGTATRYQNRTLILGRLPVAQKDSPSPHRQNAPLQQPAPARDAYIASRGKGMHQLMTKETYEREQQQKQEYIQHAAKRAKTGHPPAPKREIEIDGIRFYMKDDGSKLTRIADVTTTALETPRKAKIADVDFLRTKHGNLIRAKAVSGNHRFVEWHEQNFYHSPGLMTSTRARTTPQCENFTKHGTCPFGPGCRFFHDPSKIAICKDFLRTGFCLAGQEACDLSHDPTYHRVSACTHFLRGNCTNTACRYPHVHVSPSAPVCRPFAALGFCAKGTDCDKRHVIECPDYSNHGKCVNREKGTCHLPHIDHASAMRKATKNGSEEESDMSSGDESEDPDDEDSDLDIKMGSDDDDLELRRQRDFVSFE